MRSVLLPDTCGCDPKRGKLAPCDLVERDCRFGLSRVCFMPFLKVSF